MKRHILTLVIFSFAFCQGHAQSNYVFPMYGDSIKWSVLESFWWNGKTHLYQYSYDTSFCGESYSMVNLLGLDDFGKAYIRASDEQVFVRTSYHKPWHSANMSCNLPEKLIYDFSLVKGDTIVVNFFTNDSLIFIVDSVFFKPISGISRKHISLITPSGGSSRDWTWIQGIGTFHHPFYFIHSLFIGSETDHFLLCVDSARTSLYKDDRWNTCDTGLYLGQNQINSSEKFQIYPNPAKDVLHIKCDVIVTSYSIYNSQGKLTYQGKFENNIGVEELEPGLYFILFQTNEDILMAPFIINR